MWKSYIIILKPYFICIREFTHHVIHVEIRKDKFIKKNFSLLIRKKKGVYVTNALAHFKGDDVVFLIDELFDVTQS